MPPGSRAVRRANGPASRAAGSRAVWRGRLADRPEPPRAEVELEELLEAVDAALAEAQPSAPADGGPESGPAPRPCAPRAPGTESLDVPRPLAEIVIEEGLATAAGIERAAAAAERDSVPLVVALVRTCGIDEVALVAALKRQVRISLGDPATVAADPEAVRELPREVCQRLRVAPLGLSSYGGQRRVLRVAMADPTDAVAVAEIEHQTGCRLEPVLMTVSAVEELVEKTYRHFVTQVMRREPTRPASPPEPATAADGGEPDGTPITIPFHRLSDEADVEVRLQAVIRLLIEKRVISEDELEEALSLLMRRHDREP
jgi:hypothetical protein